MKSSKKPKEFCCGMGCRQVLCRYCYKQKGRQEAYRPGCFDKCVKRCRRFQVEKCGK